jgi:hypothetical protein
MKAGLSGLYLLVVELLYQQVDRHVREIGAAVKVEALQRLNTYHSDSMCAYEATLVFLVYQVHINVCT